MHYNTSADIVYIFQYKGGGGSHTLRAVLREAGAGWQAGLIYRSPCWVCRYLPDNNRNMISRILEVLEDRYQGI